MRTLTISLALLWLAAFVHSAGAAIIDFENYNTGSLLTGQPDTWGPSVGGAQPLPPQVVTTSSSGLYQGGKGVAYYTTLDNQRGGYIGGTNVNTYNYATNTMQADFYYQTPLNPTSDAVNLGVFGWKDLDSSGTYNAGSPTHAEASVFFGITTYDPAGAPINAPRFYLRQGQFGSNEYGGAIAQPDTWYRLTATFNYTGGTSGSVTLTAWDLTNNVAVFTDLAGTGNLVASAADLFKGGFGPADYSGTGIRVDIGTHSLGTYRVIDNIGGVNEIPEPSSIALLLLGVVGLAAVARRRK